MISIRLRKELISELKLIADYRGISYQPLIRDVLSRFARAEVRQIASELREQQKAHEEIERAEKEKQRA
jgi:predicted DNA-binding ribbon-helix-helix protein